jgi:exopolyphosphatase / guanosine-5'-triphosphate,3'-diphosphate pyrophosphatase
MTRVAVVDLGSNSTRLLVADIEGGVAHEVERRVTITKLGERVDGDRLLLPRAVDRVHACLESYCELIDRHGPKRSLAYATSAVRDAENRTAFLDGIERQFGLPTRLLSGEEEALLTFRGVSSGRDLAQPTVIVDLGGGSTEIVIGNADGLTFHASLDIGCVRLAERFGGSTPLGACDTEALVLHVRGLLMDHVPLETPPAYGIGTAGTVTTLGALHLGLDEEDPELLHGHRLPADWIGTEAARLAAMPADELSRHPGIEPGRAGVIGAGALAIAEIVGYFELAELEISEADILHGVALEAAGVRTP